MTGRTPATCTAAASPPRAGLVLAGSWGGSSTWCSAAAATTAASGSSSSSSAQGSWTGRFAASGRQTMAMTLCPARVLTPSRPAPLAQQPFGVLSGMLQSKGRAGAMDASKQACADGNASIKSDGEHHTTAFLQDIKKMVALWVLKTPPRVGLQTWDARSSFS